jgi:hypothetical protein
MTARRHVPMRRCVACRDALPKRELVRLVRGDEGWRLDLAQRAGGRGTNVCRPCALAAVAPAGTAGADPDRVKGFRRAFRQDAAAVTSLLAPIAHALATTTPVSAAEPDARPRPNGGMHG